MTHHVIKSNFLSYVLSLLLLQCLMMLFFAVFIGGKVPACEHYVGSHPAYAGWQRTVGQRPTIPLRWSLSSSAFLCAPCYDFSIVYMLCIIITTLIVLMLFPSHCLFFTLDYNFFGWLWGGTGGRKAWKRLQKDIIKKGVEALFGRLAPILR